MTLKLQKLFFLFSLLPVFLHAQSVRTLNKEGLALFQQKKYADAADKFEAACEQNPHDRVLKSNYCAALRGLARVQFKSGNEYEAQSLLEKAVELNPDESINAIELATFYRKSENESMAIYYLDKALESSPDSVDTRVRIARVFYQLKDLDRAEILLTEAFNKKPTAGICLSLATLCRDQGRLGDAIYHAERGLVISPSFSRLQSLLEKCRKEIAVEGNMQKQVSSHFNIRFEGGEALEGIDFILECCEDAYSLVGQQLYWYPDFVTEVVIYQGGDYHEVTGAPKWSSGRFDGKLRIPLKKNGSRKSTRNTIFHEYTHMVVNQLTANNCPFWVNEGLAQIMEPAFNRKAVLKSLAKAYRKKRLKPVLKSCYEKAFTQFTSVSEVRRAYALSYLAIYTLERQFGYSKISGFLAALKTSTTESVISEQFGLDYVSLSSNMFVELKNYFKQRAERSLKMKIKAGKK